MNVLLTGAFGNVGTSTLEELIKQGHQVRCFDLKTKANEKKARRFEGHTEVGWGDLRRPDDVAAAVRDQDVVVHLAFIIPKMSATGVESEARPDWAREINVGGTLNLINAMKALPSPPKIIFASSYHIYGRTQDQAPPRTVSDPIQPIEHYSRHKAECEHEVKSSGLEWTILRLSATLPLAIKLDPQIKGDSYEHFACLPRVSRYVLEFQTRAQICAQKSDDASSGPPDRGRDVAGGMEQAAG